MGMQVPPTESQGHYRYDPGALDEKGPARLFPYAGEDGILQYVLVQLRQNLLSQGKLSQPWSLLLQQAESADRKLGEARALLSTFLVDLKIFQSEWLNFNLPPDEQYNTGFVRQRRAMTAVLLSAKNAAKAMLLCNRTSDSLPVRSLFYKVLEAKGRMEYDADPPKQPLIAAIHQRDKELSDREFARQRLAGQNPMVIRRVQPADQAILQPWLGESYALMDGSTVDLTHAVTENRLFIADYPLLQHLTESDLQPGRYVGSPIALFYQANTGLEPVLIQLEKGRVVTPSHACPGTLDDWMRAKLYVQTADVTFHELISHLCYTHLAMEAFAIATPRQLPTNHPFYRLLRPHFQFLLAINTRGNTILLGEGGAIDELMAPTRKASIGLINRAYRERPFQDYALPHDIQRRGLGTEFLPDFPYRDDAMLLWNAIARYVSRYLQRYYPDDQAVQKDIYLQAWVAELSNPLDASPAQTQFPQAPTWMPKSWIDSTGLNLEHLPSYPRVPEFPPGQLGEVLSLQQLIDIATVIIFTCGPQHAAVNFSQFDYVGYVPNAPFALYSRPDVPASLEELLPPANEEVEQIALAFALSGIRWGQFGSSELIQFKDSGDRQILKQFQADLEMIEATIKARDQQRSTNSGIAYPYLLPSRIPNSINI
ncbi:lipoxygenase [Kovacikia minuta CCNUW1]|uniref:lipoxygenase family protein n=1 Tax=Kovacikia minuta TaxID=2931930 RepID=UPI001CCEE759|nr:lipoxygenase family protein [Kovacikia minuta]UBF26815.1 lipoxygenase [Kovacikia minuta CCNUW1]